MAKKRGFMGANAAAANDSERIFQWIRTILHEVDEHESATAESLLFACGKMCASSSQLMAGAVTVRKELPDDVDPDTLFRVFRKRYYSTPGLDKDGNTITLIFDTCTCPLVKAGIDNPSLCRCTTGYSKALFEALFNRPVSVTLHTSILRGDRVCRQEIIIHGDAE